MKRCIDRMKFNKKHPFGEPSRLETSEFFRQLTKDDSPPFPIDNQGNILNFADIDSEQHDVDWLNKTHRLFKLSSSSLTEQVLAENGLERYIHWKKSLENGSVYVRWRQVWIPNDCFIGI